MINPGDHRVRESLDGIGKLLLTTTEFLDSRAKLIALLLLAAIFWSGHHSAGRFQFKEDGRRVMDTRTGDQYLLNCSYLAPKGATFDPVAEGGKPITVDEREVTPASSKLVCTTQKIASIN
jgi:hypothetical protein